MEPTAIIAGPAVSATASGVAGAAGAGGAAATAGANGAASATGATGAAGIVQNFTAFLEALLAGGTTDGAAVDPTAAAGTGEGEPTADPTDLTDGAAALAAALAAITAPVAQPVVPTTPPPAAGQGAAAVLPDANAKLAGASQPTSAAPTPASDPTAAVTAALAAAKDAQPDSPAPVTDAPPPAESDATAASTAITPTTPVDAASTAAAAATADGAPRAAAQGQASNDPLPSERTSSIGRADAAAAKNRTDDVASPAAHAVTAPRGHAQGENSPEFGTGQHGTSDEGAHVALTQSITNRGTDTGHTIEVVQTPANTTAARDTFHPTPVAPTPLRDVEEMVRLSSLRSAGSLRDGGEMRLHLSPEGMGNVEVRVMVRNDAVHASLVADQDGARQALQASRPSLEAALQRSSLRLEGFTVDMGFQQHQRESQGDRQATPAQVFSNWFGPDAGATSSTIAPVTAAGGASGASSRGGLSLHA